MTETAVGPPELSHELSLLLRRFPEDSPARGEGGAAVLAVLRAGSRDIEVLLIERAVRDEDRASGHVALPGGRVHERDPTLAATALRECEEEVGLSATDFVGPTRFVRLAEASVFSLRVGVFATELGPTAGPPHAASRTEVAHVFWLPRGALATSRPVIRDTPSGPREVDAVVYDGHVLWGFTRRVLMELFDGTG